MIVFGTREEQSVLENGGNPAQTDPWKDQDSTAVCRRSTVEPLSYSWVLRCARRHSLID